MGSLQLLSALNWASAALYLTVAAAAAVFLPVPVASLAVVVSALVLVAAPFVYLGYAVEKGSGRILQSVFAVLSLLNFPLGTAFGVFALWAVWAGPGAAVFDDPSLAEGSPEGEEAPSEDGDEDSRGSETPYAYGRRLLDRGLNARAIYAKLELRGLSDEELETVMGALKLKVPPRAAARTAPPARVARPAAPAKPALKTGTRPPPRRRPNDDS